MKARGVYHKETKTPTTMAGRECWACGLAQEVAIALMHLSMLIICGHQAAHLAGLTCFEQLVLLKAGYVSMFLLDGDRFSGMNWFTPSFGRHDMPKCVCFPGEIWVQQLPGCVWVKGRETTAHCQAIYIELSG